MSQTDLALENIFERLTLFSPILYSFDDCSHRQALIDLMICSNCGTICNHNLSTSAKIAPHKPSARFTHTTVAFLGKTAHFNGRKVPFSALCFGCARAFQHCKRQNKNLIEFVRSFLHCFRQGYIGKASSGIHQDYANSSTPIQIKCHNCKIGCQDEYYHGLRTFFAVQSSCDLLKLPIVEQPYVDICAACCRAFYAAQAKILSNDGLAYEFQRLSMDPLKCLTKSDFEKEHSEKAWSTQRFLEIGMNAALAKEVFADWAISKESLITEEEKKEIDEEEQEEEEGDSLRRNSM